jgi:myo-inositol-1(or 4)-monophosphatase
MTDDDLLHDALRFALALVEEVGLRLSGIFRGREPVRREVKRDGSLLTDADIEANKQILGGIRDRFGDHGILTEEGGTTGPEERLVWIVDPLDGTTNYAAGIPLWSISLALAREGEPILGVVSFPILGRVYHALRGQGAFRDGRPIEAAASPPGGEDRGIFVTCTNTLKRYRLDVPGKLRVLGSASWNLMMVAEGRARGGMETRPKIWDVAAGQLIIEEAGGVVEYVDGRSFFPFTRGFDYRDESRPMITAVDRETFRLLEERIRPR